MLFPVLGSVTTQNPNERHRTWDSYTLSAKQIIDHHNEVLGNAFATLKETKEIQFSHEEIG